MKNIRIIGMVMLAVLSMPAMRISAQVTDTKLQLKLDEVKEKMVEFDTEHMIDSLDQEKLPRLVSGGVLAGANLSNFIITRAHHPMSSYMRIGGEIGGFLDFSIDKHFAIQPQVLFTAQENYFHAGDSANHLWSFGMEIPVYFLGRFGSLEQGYLQFGGGIFTHFTFASNIANKFRNVDEPEATKPVPMPIDTHDYSRLYSLHNNHFGVCATVGYEFAIGIQINVHYKVSLSDIAGFYSEMKGQEVANALIYPQSISLVLGYRWR